MTTCDPEPTVNNAKVTVVNDTDIVTATFECMSGFYMTGTARVICNRTLDVWDPVPVCNVIYQGSNIYNYIPSSDSNDAWPYIMAIMLTLIAVILIVALVLCCCCPHGWPMFPYSAREGNRCQMNCCRRGSTGDNASRADETVFWVNNPHRGSVVTAVETPRDGQVYSQLYRQPKPAKDPAAESKMWMPHRHIIRHNNTSTK